MGNADIRKHCTLDEECSSLMRVAMQRYQLSARAYHRVLKLARTIADLAGGEKITATFLAEALQYRPAHRCHLGGNERNALRGAEAQSLHCNQ